MSMTASAPAPALDERISGATILALVAMGFAVFVFANDFTALGVALPRIQHDLHVGVGAVQWLINAYALVFGALIVTGGRLADMFGRRRVFFIGAAIFALCSAVGGLAQGAGLLIGARALMGLGGALLWPATLGMTYAVLPPRKAGLAGGLIIGVAGLGNAFGPMLGGALTDALSWRAIFFLNLPIVACACAGALWLIHQPRETHGARIDYAGVLTLSAALTALLLALEQVGNWGWGDVRIIALLGTAAALVALFALVERGGGEGALVPRAVSANRPFAAAALAVLLISATYFALVVYLPQTMERLLGYSPLHAGVGLLPMMTTFAATSFIAGSLYARLGQKLIVGFGAACIAVGALLVSRLQLPVSYGALVPGMALSGIGIGVFYSTITTAAVTALDRAQWSLAGGIVYMCQITGGSIGLGLATALFTSASRGASPDRGFVSGIHAGLGADAALALAGVVITVLFVGGRLPVRRFLTARDADATMR